MMPLNQGFFFCSLACSLALSVSSAGTIFTTSASALVAAGFVSDKQLVKVLANGTLTAKLTVEAHAFSAKAVEAIEAVGGTVVKL